MHMLTEETEIIKLMNTNVSVLCCGQRMGG
jgi:hypothetical protein